FLRINQLPEADLVYPFESGSLESLPFFREFSRQVNHGRKWIGVPGGAEIKPILALELNVDQTRRRIPGVGG
ncbi:MAG TPA: hypothetical protein VI114_05605, partial [Chthoniobacterales bacterium]